MKRVEAVEAVGAAFPGSEQLVAETKHLDTKEEMARSLVHWKLLLPVLEYC